MNRHATRDGSPQTWTPDDAQLLEALEAFAPHPTTNTTTHGPNSRTTRNENPT